MEKNKIRDDEENNDHKIIDKSLPEINIYIRLLLVVHLIDVKQIQKISILLYNILLCNEYSIHNLY